MDWMQFRLLIILALVLTWGCGNERKNIVAESNHRQPKILVGHADDESNLPEGVELHKARDPDAPVRVERTPIVIDDVAEINRTRQTYEKGIDELYDCAIANVVAGEYRQFEDYNLALKVRRERAVADLGAIVRDRRAAASARTNAAEALIALGDASGEEFLFEMLKSPSQDLRLAALGNLRAWGVEIDFSRSDRAARVLALLNDDDESVVQAAANLCTFRKIPGTEEKLIALLESKALKDPASIATQLAAVASTKRAVEALLPYVLKDDDDEFKQSTGYTFRRLIEHQDPEVSGPVRKALYSYALRFRKQRYDQVLVDHLAKSAGQDATAVLEDIAKNATDPMSRSWAVEALARLQPDRAVRLLTDEISREGARSDILRTLRPYATENDFDRIAPLLLQSIRKPGKQFDKETVRLMLEKLGNRGTQFITEHIDDLDKDARMWATWKLDGLNLTAALTELYAAGVIKTPPPQMFDKMQNGRKDKGDGQPLDTSDPTSFFSALAWEGIVTMFDAETSMVPCHHDRLILAFAKASGGQFMPQWPIQTWHRTNENDYDAPYTIQFVLNGRLFRIGAENYGDWYDVEAVARLNNFALETVGRSERFITLDSGGQLAAFVFADPAAFLPIARKYRLPLSDDASKAMRQGIEFEKRVIEQTK